MSNSPKKKMKIDESLEAEVEKLVASLPNQQQYDFDSEGSEASELPADENDVDMLHLAPLYVDESEDWPQHVTLQMIRSGKVRYHRNYGFEGSWHPSQMASLSGDYYRYNKNNHFVWTNQLVVGKCVEVDVDLNSIDTEAEKVEKLGLDPGTVIDYESCDLMNPEDSFQLRKVEPFGIGLFAKHFIKKG